MENAVAVKNEITASQIDDYLVSFGLAEKLTPQERKQFVEVSMAFNLNPFKREIYCIPYGKGDKRKLSIITGYETYLKRADRTGRLAGWRAWTEGTYKVETVKKHGYNGDYEVRRPVGDLKAVVEITIAGWQKPFVHEVYLDEYAQDNDMWASKPRTMLKKVVIAQGFRMAFPDDMGGMPYTSDELPDTMTGGFRDVTPVDNNLQVEQQAEKPVENVETPADLEWARWKAEKAPAVKAGITESIRVLGFGKAEKQKYNKIMQEMVDAKDWRSLEDLQSKMYEQAQEAAEQAVAESKEEEEIF